MIHRRLCTAQSTLSHKNGARGRIPCIFLIITTEFAQNILNTAGNIHTFFSCLVIIQNCLQEKVDTVHWNQSAHRFGKISGELASVFYMIVIWLSENN